jgi:hypothetical protein
MREVRNDKELRGRNLSPKFERCCLNWRLCVHAEGKTLFTIALPILCCFVARVIDAATQSKRASEKGFEGKQWHTAKTKLKEFGKCSSVRRQQGLRPAAITENVSQSLAVNLFKIADPVFIKQFKPRTAVTL